MGKKRKSPFKVTGTSREVKVVSSSPQCTLRLGGALAHCLRRGDIICLIGNLGAGKTLFTKGVARGLGLDKNEVLSPTFILMRAYLLRPMPLYHFDLYRLFDEQEIVRVGYEEYFYGDGVAIIEWADKLKTLLPQEYLEVKISMHGETKRIFRCKAHGGRYIALLEEFHEDLSA
jgi:tRNA threonylcarbamoyladenosine biosynthesis protein TsaE